MGIFRAAEATAACAVVATARRVGVLRVCFGILLADRRSRRETRAERRGVLAEAGGIFFFGLALGFVVLVVEESAIEISVCVDGGSGWSSGLWL